jgi:hypothetical protein
MKLSLHECLRLIAETEARLHEANSALRELRTNDPGRGSIVIRAARLFAEKERLERMLERGGESDGGTSQHSRNSSLE